MCCPVRPSKPSILSVSLTLALSHARLPFYSFLFIRHSLTSSWYMHLLSALIPSPCGLREKERETRDTSCLLFSVLTFHFSFCSAGYLGLVLDFLLSCPLALPFCPPNSVQSNPIQSNPILLMERLFRSRMLPHPHGLNTCNKKHNSLSLAGPTSTRSSHARRLVFTPCLAWDDTKWNMSLPLLRTRYSLSSKETMSVCVCVCVCVLWGGG
jgi:hypothetical protein